MRLLQARRPRAGSGHRHIRSVATLLAVSAILASAGQALASSPRPSLDVNVVACDPAAGGGTGTVDVPAGTAFDIAWDWETFTVSQEAAFYVSVKVAADIDGRPIANAWRYWTRPYYVAGADYPWFMFWKYPHRALRDGEAITFHVTPSLRFQVFDGTDWYPRGPIITLTCTIRGVDPV